MKRLLLVAVCAVLAGCATQMPRFRETVTEYDDSGAVTTVTETVIGDTAMVLGKSSMKNVGVTVDYYTDKWALLFKGGNEYMEGEELSPALLAAIKAAVQLALAGM